MKARFLIVFILSAHFSYAQLETPVADTMIYTFKVQLIQENLKLDDDDCRWGFGLRRFYEVTFKYRVLESDCKVPLLYVNITHLCPEKIYFKTGNIYTAKGRIEFKECTAPEGFRSYQGIPEIKCEYMVRDFSYEANKKK